MWRTAWTLPFCILILAILSLTTLRSVVTGLVSNQAVFFILGSGIFGATAVIPRGIWYRYSWILYIGLVALLALTLIVGTVTKGSTRWISIPGLFNIQSSQLAVPIGALTLAQFNKNRSTKLKKFIANLSIVGIPAGLIFIEPDLGTTIIFLAAMAVIMWLVTDSWQILASSLLLGLCAVVASWLMVLQPYQKARILSFVSPQHDLSGAGYNAQQSLIAVGSGAWWGRGLGQGVQSHLRFLPERQTDFIFASLAEELGFIGSSLVLGVYTILIAHLLIQAQTTHAVIDQLYLYGITTMLVLQVVVNIGMNMGLLPITGLTLPFVSYGGSSILSLCFCLGIAQNIVIDHRERAQLFIT